MAAAEARPRKRERSPDSHAKAWLAAEPDEDMRGELSALLAEGGDALAARFAGRLEFGTAGLRAAVGAGPLRMNRLSVRHAAAGLVDYLLAEVPGSKDQGIIIGFDMRRKSDLFARDTALVAAARGMKAMLLPEPLPTPVLAWNITRVGAAAGVMVTASHNPPADNGYKVYLGTSGQIVPPQDAHIAAAIARLDATRVELAPEGHPLVRRLGAEALEAYLDWVPSVRLQPKLSLSGVTVAYTAMHGVGAKTLEAAFARVGAAAPVVVQEQHVPDGTFPTVSFPNPEEPGAMDLLLERAKGCGAHVALANDPDADRLAVAIPLKDGTWRRLAGDEIGWLLGDYILRTSTGEDRLVVTTLVSSALLGKMASAHGVAFQETFTGFKWMAHAALQNPDKRLVFAYEQAIGFLVASRPLDKDGVSAAVVLVELVASLAAAGSTVEARLEEIAQQYGRHVTAEISVRMDPAAGSAAVARLRKDPPSEVAGMKVAAVRAFPEANLLRLWLGEEGGAGVRVQIRPSGTEPKVKIYGEAVGADPKAALEAAAELLKQ